MKPAAFDPSAEEEYLAAIDYYENQRPGLGLELQAEVERALQAILEDPQKYPLYEGEDVRQCIIRRFPYSVIYFEDHERVWIVAVAHHKRKPGYWKRRLD